MTAKTATNRATKTGKTGRYIYGVVEGSLPQPLSVAGILGEEDHPYALSDGRFAAIVSAAPLTVYENTPEHMLAHNKVLETILAERDVLPLRFGTVAEGDEAVRDFLRMTHTALAEAFAMVKGKVEYDVEVEANEAKLLDDLRKTNPVIQQIRSLSQGQTITVAEQMKIGQVVAQELAKEKLRLAALIKSTLADSAAELKVLRFPKPVTVLNLACLLNKDLVSAFEQMIYELDRTLEDRVRFKLTGPLPAYHFSELRMTVIDFASVDQARKTLGLPLKATLTQIKQVHRELAKQHHPDVAQQDPQAEATFRGIDHAYKLLVQYCEHTPQRVYSFRPEAFGKRVILADREERIE